MKNPRPTGQDPETLQRLALEVAAGEPGSPGLLRISVAGSSMAPTLRAGDAIHVRPAGFAELGPGDVITFLTNTGPVTHRVVGRAGGDLITKGDNARTLDPPVRPETIVGRVEAVDRAGVARRLRRGLRGAWVARLSLLEGRLNARLDPQRRTGAWSTLAGLPLRILIAIVASPRLSR